MRTFYLFNFFFFFFFACPLTTCTPACRWGPFILLFFVFSCQHPLSKNRPQGPWVPPDYMGAGVGKTFPVLILTNTANSVYSAPSYGRKNNNNRNLFSRKIIQRRKLFLQGLTILLFNFPHLLFLSNEITYIPWKDYKITKHRQNHYVTFAFARLCKIPNSRLLIVLQMHWSRACDCLHTCSRPYSFQNVCGCGIAWKKWN